MNKPTNDKQTYHFDEMFPTRNNVHGTAQIKSKPQDFLVFEANSIEFSNQGEHLYLYIEKKGHNTNSLARHLAKACGVAARNVSFAGMKDKNAITRQWFSVQLPKVDNPNQIAEKLPESTQIIHQHRHSKKLKRGQLDKNRFELILRNFQGERSQVEKNIAEIKKSGVPNYFGPQRFGFQMQNIEQAKHLFQEQEPKKNIKRHLKSLLISASRALIFNTILAERIKNNLWNQALDGDLMQLNGSQSWFPSSQATDDELQQRLKQFDIHITAPLWGEKILNPNTQAADLELDCARQHAVIKKGLEKIRANTERRAIRVLPQNLNYDWVDKNTLKLQFDLPKGSYATSVIREIVRITESAEPS